MTVRKGKEYGFWRRTMKASGYAPNTIATAIRCVQAVANGCKVEPWELTTEMLEELFERKAYRKATLRGYVRWVRAYCKWARIPDITKGLRMPAQPKYLPDPVGEEHVPTLVLDLPFERHREWAAWGCFMGLRAFEVAKLHAKDFVAHGRDMMLRIVGKGEHEALLLVHPFLLKLIRPRLDAANGGFLYPGLSGRAHVAADSVSRGVKVSARRLGVVLRFHQCRHRYGTMVHELGRDLLLTMFLMRHRSPSTTVGYAEISDPRARQVLRALPWPDRSRVIERRPVRAKVPGPRRHGAQTAATAMLMAPARHGGGVVRRWARAGF